MIFISKTTTGVFLQRDELDIAIDGPAIPSTLGLIITALIDSGRALGDARRAGYEAGLSQGYQQCERELLMSARIAERQQTDLVDALLISGLVVTA